MGNEKLYLIATNEVDNGQQDEALWAKAIALCEGDQEKARYKYITLRVEVLGNDRVESQTASEALNKRNLNVKTQHDLGGNYSTRLIKASEYSERLNIPVDRIISMIRDGEISGRISGNTWYVEVKENVEKNKSSLKQIGWIFLAGVLMHLPAQIITTTSFNASIWYLAPSLVAGALGMGMFAIVIGVVLFLIIRYRVNGPLIMVLVVMIIISIIVSYGVISLHWSVIR
jgi:preprotein translocase subunit SecD